MSPIEQLRAIALNLPLPARMSSADGECPPPARIRCHNGPFRSQATCRHCRPSACRSARPRPDSRSCRLAWRSWRWLRARLRPWLRRRLWTRPRILPWWRLRRCHCWRRSSWSWCRCAVGGAVLRTAARRVCTASSLLRATADIRLCPATGLLQRCSSLCCSSLCGTSLRGTSLRGTSLFGTSLCGASIPIQSLSRRAGHNECPA